VFQWVRKRTKKFRHTERQKITETQPVRATSPLSTDGATNALVGTHGRGENTGTLFRNAETSIAGSIVPSDYSDSAPILAVLRGHPPKEALCRPNPLLR
jgi:hypothetical protein